MIHHDQERIPVGGMHRRPPARREGVELVKARVQAMQITQPTWELRPQPRSAAVNAAAYSSGVSAPPLPRNAGAAKGSRSDPR